MNITHVIFVESLIAIATWGMAGLVYFVAKFDFTPSVEVIHYEGDRKVKPSSYGKDLLRYIAFGPFAWMVLLFMFVIVPLVVMTYHRVKHNVLNSNS